MAIASTTKKANRFLNGAITASAVIYGIVLLTIPLELVEALWLLAPQLWIPLLLKASKEEDAAAWSASAAICGCGIAVSFCLQPGTVAGSIATLWLLWVGTYGLTHLRRSSLLNTVSCIYLMVGAVWFTAARFNQPLLDYPLGITFLTGVHFHFGGFLLIELAMRLSRVSMSRGAKLAPYGVASGFPLVAFGMRNIPPMEFAGVVIVLFSTLLFAIELLRLAWRSRDWLSRIAGMLAVASTATAVAFGLNYGWGQLDSIIRVQIPTMIQWHGAAHAIGLIGSAILIQSRCQSTAMSDASRPND